MLEHLRSIVSEFSCLPKRLQRIVCSYVLFLMLDHKKHELRSAARVFHIHESNFSRLLSRKKSRVIARSLLNHSIKKRLAKVKKTDEIYMIIDATLSKRSGKKVKNRKKFRHGGPYVEGHQFTNFILLVNGEVIPIASMPFYSKEYCKEKGYGYQSEIDHVADWIELLPKSGLLPEQVLENLHFLLDSGYDARPIQAAIASINAYFTTGIRCERSVNGLGVREYFNRYRHIPWKTIRLTVGNGHRKTKGRKFRVRQTKMAHLKGFGKVNVVCSEKASRSAKRKTVRKYIATNMLTQSARGIVLAYSKRWIIEVWHKEIKQKFGFGDCRSQKFEAIEAHVNFVLVAYCLRGLKDPLLPKPGTTLDQYQSSLNWKEAAKVINLFDGRQKLKKIAHAEMQQVVNG